MSNPSEIDHWRDLFEYAPISLWEEDYSAIRQFFDSLRAEGVTDLRGYLAGHPGAVRACMSKIVVLDVNRRTLDLFGAESKKELLANLDKIFRDRMDVHFADELVDMWNGAKSYEREGVNYSLKGEPIDIQLWWCVLPGHEQTLDRVLVSISDITARKRAENYLRYLGTHDVMTGLYNRAFFVEEQERVEKEGPYPVSILIADLNDLKRVNDTFGHEEGDNLLRRTAEIFKAAFTDNEIVARMGGDEFAVLLPNIKASESGQVLKRIHKLVSLNNTYYQGPDLHISLGIATGTRGHPLTEVQRQADDRMYAEKREYHQLAGQ
ncbi:MAG: sensor domain-containing diguanylate cyclase [Chloroflexi bacterium]|nr:sensor domain-containing diguanylate cyclase [Chloroflexota bacterium]